MALSYWHLSGELGSVRQACVDPSALSQMHILNTGSLGDGIIGLSSAKFDYTPVGLVPRVGSV